MTTALKAGVAYFAVIFAIGFALGTLRVIVLAPRLGELGAVLLEVPVMLLASWMICRRLTQRLRVPENVPSRLTMGASAFALLMIAEVALSIWVFDNSIRTHFGNYLTAHGGVGVAGQIVFAAIPVIQGRSRR